MTHLSPVDLRGKTVDAHGEDGAADEGLRRPEKIGVDQLVVDGRLRVQVIEHVGDDVVEGVSKALQLLLLALGWRLAWRSLGDCSHLRRGCGYLGRGCSYLRRGCNYLRRGCNYLRRGCNYQRRGGRVAKVHMSYVFACNQNQHRF
jgi:hypothetical protein